MFGDCAYAYLYKEAMLFSCTFPYLDQYVCFDHFFSLLLMLCGCTFYRADVQLKHEFILSCDSHVTNVLHRKCYHTTDMSWQSHDVHVTMIITKFESALDSVIAASVMHTI